MTHAVKATPAVIALCAEYDLTLLGKHAAPKPGETRATSTITRILKKHGEGHTRLVLSTLTETQGTSAVIDEPLLWSTSDLTRACSGFIERRASDWLAFWDVCPVGQIQSIAQRLSGQVPQRAALSGMLFERLFRAFGDEVIE